MTKRLQVGDEIFNYPTTGDSNYGESATAWATAVTDVLTNVIGPGDILTQQTELVGASGNVSGLVFDVSFVQRIVVEGFISRETQIDPMTVEKKIESFMIEGVYNGADFIYSVEYVGDDTLVELSFTGGQCTFTQTVIPDSTVTIKFKAKSIIDEEILGL